MLTLESKFSEFIELCHTYGACGPAGDWVYTKEDNMTIKEALDLAAQDNTVQGGAWTYWAIKHFGKELEPIVRKIYIQNTVTSPTVACRLYMDCASMFTEDEIILLKGLYEGKINSTTVKDPMDAARVYIDCASVLNEADSLALKAVFDGKLPTVEKELRDGVITRATAEVAP